MQSLELEVDKPTFQIVSSCLKQKRLQIHQDILNPGSYPWLVMVRASIYRTLVWKVYFQNFLKPIFVLIPSISKKESPDNVESVYFKIY